MLAHLVASAATNRTVIVADSAGAAALDVVRAAGQSLVTQDGGVLVQVDGTLVVEQTPPAPVPAPRGRRGRRGRAPWGRLAVVRRLLEAGPLSQADLALLSGVGQPTVSKALTEPRQQGWVDHTAHGWAVVDRDGLLQDWLRQYPTGGELWSTWLSLEPLDVQVARLAEAATGQRLALTGDLAADRLAPWRHPTLVDAYIHAGLDLTPSGFVRCDLRDASLRLRVSADPAVFLPCAGTDADAKEGAAVGPGDDGSWTMLETSAGPVPIADPLQVLRDVLGNPAPDAAEAGEVLKEALTQGWVATRLRDHLLALTQAPTASPVATGARS